jgi:hypothetical protein
MKGMEDQNILKNKEPVDKEVDTIHDSDRSGGDTLTVHQSKEVHSLNLGLSI